MRMAMMMTTMMNGSVKDALEDVCVLAVSMRSRQSGPLGRAKG